MKSCVIADSLLPSRARWDPKSIISSARQAGAARRATTPLADLVVERKTTVQPPLDPSASFIYIGLENVESRTGDIVGDIVRHGGQVRSRSKLYRQGDVLFGRLRPNLAKVYYCGSAESEGYCSSEFLVLRPKSAVTSGLILRQLLASTVVINEVSQWIAGAALPRAPLEALLSVEVPIFDATRRQALEAELQEAAASRTHAKALLAMQPDELDAAVWRAADQEL